MWSGWVGLGGLCGFGIVHPLPGIADCSEEAASPLAAIPYALRHAAVSTWLNAGVAPPQVAEWAGHSVDVLLRVYAKCIHGQQEAAKQRIEDTMRSAKEGTDKEGTDEKDADEEDERPD